MADMPKVGDRVNITLLDREVVSISRFGDVVYRGVDGTTYQVRSGAVTMEVLKPRPPKWQRGDVVIIEFNPADLAYTYVRGVNNWPGDQWPLSDERVNEYWQRGMARHVLRDGQPV